MDFELLGERIRNSYRYITKNKNPDLEDDCVQECLLAFWQKGKGQTVDQAVIDFLRSQNGYKNSPNYETRLNLMNAIEIPESLTVNTELSERVDTSILDGRLKQMIDFYICGYTMKEIGSYFGVTESRVSQFITDFTSKMQILSILPKETKKWAAMYAFKS